MKTPVETRHILDEIEAQHPDADTELHYGNAFELLVATMLSAQSTDQRVNMVTPALFKRYPDARRLARATTKELEPQIHSTGFFRAKSKSLIGMAQALVERHGGEVPASMEALIELPGVGRKTANVVLGHALGVPGLPVDRHVLRVANRIGIAESDDPVLVESQLCGALPPARWTRTSDTLILHGRRICRPKPLCDSCAVRDDCDYFTLVISRPQKPSRTHRITARPKMRASSASEPRERPASAPKALRRGLAEAFSEGGSAPAKRRARERVGESEGRSPSDKRRKA